MEDKDLKVVRVLEAYMGGFCAALAKACFKADKSNLERIKAAFPDYWKQAARIAERLESEKVRSQQYDDAPRGTLCTDCWVQHTWRRRADVIINGHPVCVEHAGGTLSMALEEDLPRDGQFAPHLKF